MGWVRRFWTSIWQVEEEPEMVLQKAIDAWQDELISVRQAMACAIATRKNCERQIAHLRLQANYWQEKAIAALQTNEEETARMALKKKQIYSAHATTLLGEITKQQPMVSRLQEQIQNMEQRLSQLKLKKDMYLARLQSASHREKLQQVQSNIEVWDTLQSIEEENHRLEIELAGYSDSLEKRFRELERE